MTLCDFSTLATCYAELNGRDRPEAVGGGRLLKVGRTSPQWRDTNLLLGVNYEAKEVRAAKAAFRPGMLSKSLVGSCGAEDKHKHPVRLDV